MVRPDGMSVDPDTGVIVWQPGVEDIGSHHVFLRVRDGRGGVDLQTFEVQVTAGGTAPVITTGRPPPRPSWASRSPTASTPRTPRTTPSSSAWTRPPPE